ncbi:MAG: RNA polymerase sigma factor [Elusimicrobiota bacterium]
MTSNQEKLIEESQEGNLESFGRLIDKYKDRIFKMAMSFCKDKVEAEEIAQLVFIKLWKKIDKFKFKSSFSTWLYRVAHNTFYDHIRKQKRRSNRKVSTDKLNYLKDTDNPYKKLEKEEEVELLKEALSNIPEKFSMAVIFYDIEGRSYKEISDIIEKPVGTVKSRLYRGRKLLKEKLGNKIESRNV